MRFGWNLSWAGLPNFSKKAVLVTQKTSDKVIFNPDKFAFSSIFGLFAPFWSSIDNTMAIELLFGKPNVDYQKLIFCAAAFMAAR
jgi:hypothetical protein